MESSKERFNGCLTPTNLQISLGHDGITFNSKYEEGRGTEQAGLCEFKVSIFYIARSWSSRAYIVRFCLKKTNKPKFVVETCLNDDFLNMLDVWKRLSLGLPSALTR